MRILLLSWMVILLFAQCRHDSPSSDQQTSPTPSTGGASSEKSAVPEIKILTFICQTVMDEYENPHSQVFLQINEQRIKIADISACDIIGGDSFTQYEMPANALAACGGWWAGAGDYLYAVREGTHIKVMKGWQDEAQEDKGFHYELAKDIDLSNIQE